MNKQEYKAIRHEIRKSFHSAELTKKWNKDYTKVFKTVLGVLDFSKTQRQMNIEVKVRNLKERKASAEFDKFFGEIIESCVAVE